jgi:hypothetical protein
MRDRERIEESVDQICAASDQIGGVSWADGSKKQKIDNYAQA